ncbi:MAG TPA: adenosylmethionine--8-amino-7-oxononanoate transaminase [Burkholderiales bacterium]
MNERSPSERSIAAVWHPCTQMKTHERVPPVAIARGSGAWLYDLEGRRYLDAISSWWVNLFGHANPRINAALRDQLERLEHVMLAGFTHEPVVELSEQLAALTGGHLGHCFYASDGASAVEIALKMSAHYWRNRGLPKKHRFVALANGYHGETLGALAVTDLGLFKAPYADLVIEAAKVPSPDWRLAEPGETPTDYAGRCAAALESHLQRYHTETAAVVVEPLVQCAGGMAMYHPEYLRRARALCERFAVHLIADEIAVGMGRTGTMLACEQAAITPDFLCLSKGLSGGTLPLSVVLASDAVYRAFYDDDPARGFLHSHSYTGNPLACRAALATLAIFRDDDVIAGNRARAQKLTRMLAPLAAHPRVRAFRNTGMIWAFEVEGAGPQFPARFHAAALERGLLLRPLGGTVYFMPPYVLDDEQCELLASETLALVDAVE